MSRVRGFGHRVGNLSAAHADAYPNYKPVPQPERVQAGWFCSVCLCIVKERAPHAACSATEKQIRPHMITVQ